MYGSKSRDSHHDGNPPRGVRRVQGLAADGRVTVTVSPAGELLGVHVHPGPYQPEDPPGLENMGDMVVEALIDAKTKALALAHPDGDG
jgi:DNA-binding protein YbaB